jgi:hypothetical protein
VRLLRRWFDPATALVATVAMQLASSLLYYTLVSPSYSHAASFFAVTLFLSTWIATRDRLTAAGGVALGATIGLMTLVRWQDLLFASIAALPLLARFAAGTQPAGERARLARFAALSGAAALVTFVPQLWVWKSIYGSWFTVPQGQDWVRWTRPEILPTLISLDAGGLFTWTPITLIGLMGLWLFRAREPAIAVPALVALALEIYLEATVRHGLGGAYGARRLIGGTALFAIGFAVVLGRMRAWRNDVAAWALAAVLIAWNGLLLVEYQQLAHAPGRTGAYPTLREILSHAASGG